MARSSYLTVTAPVPSGYPHPTRYPVFLSIPDPTRFSFGNHRVAGNPKLRVLPDISGKPEILGTTRNFGYYPIFRVSPIRGKQYHHQVLFSGTHKKDPRVQKSAKSAILTSSMTVELLLVGQSLFNQSITFIGTKGALSRPITIPSHPSISSDT